MKITLDLTKLTDDLLIRLWNKIPVDGTKAEEYGLFRVECNRRIDAGVWRYGSNIGYKNG